MWRPCYPSVDPMSTFVLHLMKGTFCVEASQDDVDSLLTIPIPDDILTLQQPLR